jgi:Dolichyl-phosphate-mannose-protein mannosyltransferase
MPVESNHLEAKASKAEPGIALQRCEEEAIAPRRGAWRRVAPATAIFFGSLLIAVLIQVRAGAARNSFTAYPDEPSHFVGSVMVRDYLAKPILSPLEFARDYYWHYPYFAIGYWPPMFYLMTGVWLLIAGVGRAQALLMGAAAAALSATAIAVMARRSADWLTGAAAGLIYLSLPVVQFWMCAVMLDQWVCAFALIAALFLCRYLEGRGSSNMLGFSLFAAFCVLTKYSGLFICVLPFVAILLPSAWKTLRKPAFLLYPVLILSLVVPWAAWTSKLAFRGLPAERSGSFISRFFQFGLGFGDTLPAILVGAVVVGLTALVCNPKEWSVEVRVMAFGCLCLTGFLALSPVNVESRYLLFGTASLLILSFFGLAPILRNAGRRGVLFLPSFAIVSAAFYLGRVPREPENFIRSAVHAVANNPKWDGKSILVPSDLEGVTIAEFVLADRHRPGHLLQRPSKLFANENWFGRNYALRYGTPREVMELLTVEPVDVIMIHNVVSGSSLPHEAVLRQMLRDYPNIWKLSASVAIWQIYEYAPRKVDHGPPTGQRRPQPGEDVALSRSLFKCSDKLRQPESPQKHCQHFREVEGQVKTGRSV